VDERRATGRWLRRWELLLWASLYPAYLAIRSLTISDRDQALAHASRLVELERAAGLLHELSFQHFFASIVEFFSVYYIAGFGPLIAAVLVWLGIRHRELYRELRTLLFGSLGIAIFFYILYPTAPPRLVPGLGIADTVGMGAHDTGSFAGIHLNPYAAMPSMHVGWSLLVAIVGFRAASSPALRTLFLAPLVIAITVTATGNHYFIDSLAGAAAALAAVGAVAVYKRSRSRSSEHRSSRLVPLSPRHATSQAAA
jgi:PAP2 superfamily